MILLVVRIGEYVDVYITIETPNHETRFAKPKAAILQYVILNIHEPNSLQCLPFG